MRQQQQNARSGNASVQAFLDFMVDTKRGGRPGVSVVAVSLQDLEGATDLRVARAELGRRLSDKARAMQARFFDLNSRLFLIVPPQDEWQLMQSVYEIRMLVLGSVGRQASELGFDPSEFTRVLHTRRHATELAQIARAAVFGPDALQGAVGPGGNLTQQHVEAVAERAAAVGAPAFLREFGRIQAIARIEPDRPARAVGREVYISMADLQRQLLNGVNISASRNMFRELTMRLDEIVLRSLSESRMVQGQISVNLNVASLLTPEFERVAGTLAERDATELWVELDVTDILGHLDAFREARKTMRRNRVYAMADSISPDLVPAAEGTGLELDGYKFVHAPEDPKLSRIGEVITDLKHKRRTIVLSRVEHEGAIAAAQDLGIRFFQGFLIDDLLSRSEAGQPA